MPILVEAISHLEDLDVKTFIDLMRRFSQLQASEKLDGLAMWIGVDQEGKIFSTPTGKDSITKKFYSGNDYPYFAGNNAYRGALDAILAKKAEVTSILAPGDLVELQVLYGRQPNAVTYGLDNKNFISFIRGINGTNDLKVDQLTGVLQNQEVSVRSIVVTSPDGENLDRKSVTESFRFVGLQKVDTSQLKGVKIEPQLKKLEKFLAAESGVQTLTNYDLLQVSLGSIPKEEREEAKKIKADLIAHVRSMFIKSIKKELLDKLLKKLKPNLAASDLSNDEDLGVHGVVLRDPISGEQLKLVDKSGYDTLNKFNYAVRDQISGTVRTVDDAASLESRGGILGVMKIRIAELLGNIDLAQAQGAKRIFSDERGANPTETLRNVAKILNGAHDFNGTKRKIEAVITATLQELQLMLKSFKKNIENPETSYKLSMRTGKTIGLTKEIIDRTLLSFAESKRNLEELKDSVNKTASFDQLIGVLYGRAARDVHSDDAAEAPITEEVLLERRNYTDVVRYKEVQSAWSLLNIYLATVMMSTIIYKAHDARGLKLVRDKAHYRLTKYNDSMSALNFWGVVLWHPSRPATAKLLQKKVATELYKIVRKVPAQWVTYLHMDLSFGKDVPIDWQDHYKTLKFLIQHAQGMNTDRINDLLSNTFKYEELSHDEKVKYLPKLYFYAQQFVPTSPLITRIRAIQNDVLGGTPDGETVMAPGQKLLGEDGEIAGTPSPSSGSSGATTAASSATTSKNIAPVETRIGETHQIVRRKRNPNLKFGKFRRPTEENK